MGQAPVDDRRVGSRTKSSSGAPRSSPTMVSHQTESPTSSGFWLTILPGRTSSPVQITSLRMNGSSVEVVRGDDTRISPLDPERAIELYVPSLTRPSPLELVIELYQVLDEHLETLLRTETNAGGYLRAHERPQRRIPIAWPSPLGVEPARC